MNVSTTMSTMDSEGVSTGDVSMLGGRSDPRSPMSLGHLGASTLSMRAKAARKRRVNAQHNSNFRAGYVPVEESQLHRSGIRGRKRYFLYCVVAILMMVALLNTLVTAWLLYILGMSHYGMASIELTTMRGRDFLRVLADASIITMSFNDAPLGSRYKSELTVEAKEVELEIKASSKQRTGSAITMNGGNITLTTDEFCINPNGSGHWISVNLPSLASHKTIKNFFADNVTASEIHGIKDFSDLFVESTKLNVDITGHKGVNVTSMKNIGIDAPTVSLRSQSSINIGSKRGLYFDTNLPKVTTSDPIDHNLLTYKVCVCLSGQIFVLPVTRPGISCDVGPALKDLCGNTI